MFFSLASRASSTTPAVARVGCLVAIISALAGCAGRQHRPSAMSAERGAGDAGRSITVVTVTHEGTRATRTYGDDTQAASDDEFLWGGSDVPVGPTGIDRAVLASPAVPASPESPPMAPPKLPDDGVFVDGPASRYQIQAALEDSRAELNACVSSAAGGSLTGSVIAAFKIDSGGVVRRVDLRKSTFKDPAVDDCLARVLRALDVPEARGRETSVIYPLHFGDARSSAR